jgi:hypothetical protein
VWFSSLSGYDIQASLAKTEECLRALAPTCEGELKRGVFRRRDVEIGQYSSISITGLLARHTKSQT